MCVAFNLLSLQRREWSRPEEEVTLDLACLFHLPRHCFVRHTQTRYVEQ